jgi:hypothetical protein
LTSNISNMKKCGINNCNRFANIGFSYCKPCHDLQIATKHKCNSCDNIVDTINIRKGRTNQYIHKVYCTDCIMEYHMKVKKRTIDAIDAENQRIKLFNTK